MKPGDAIFDLVTAHFEQNHTELSCLGITYEVFGERAGSYTVFGLDNVSGSRFIMAHDVDFTEACIAVALAIEEDTLRELSRTAFRRQA